MISETVKEYIETHAFCPEYLFKDWNAFLDLLYSEGGRVTAILWWDHCRKTMQHLSAGSGGYADPFDPEYMYAETQFCEEGLETLSLDELKEHIRATRAAGLILADKYFAFDPVPSFDLVGQP